MLTKFFRHLPLHIRSPAEVESTYQLIQVLYLLNIESQSQGKLLKKEPFMIIKSPRHFWFFSRRFRRFVKTFGFRVDFRFRFREFGESGIAAFSEPRLGFVRPSETENWRLSKAVLDTQYFGTDQCDQIERFWELLATKVASKVGQIFGDFFGQLWSTALFIQKLLLFHLGQLFEKFGYFIF